MSAGMTGIQALSSLVGVLSRRLTSYHSMCYADYHVETCQIPHEVLSAISDRLQIYHICEVAE